MPVTPDKPERLISSGSEELALFLGRPIVFDQPNRSVDPPSWLGHIPFAFWIVEALRPAVLVELGTHSGNSYAAFAQAVLSLKLPTCAYAVDTWRGDPQAGFYGDEVFEEFSAYHEQHYSSFSRLIRSTFEAAVQHFSDGTIDLLHVDGYHTYDAASADLERWRPKLSSRGVILIHDINVRERDFGTWRLWEELRAAAPHFEFLHSHGLGVVAAGRDYPPALQWLFSQQRAAGTDAPLIRQFFAQLGGAIAAKFELAKAHDKAGQHLVADAAQRQALVGVAQELEAARAAQTAREVTLHETATELERTRADLARVAAERDATKAALMASAHEHSELQERLQQLAADSESARLDLEMALADERHAAIDLREQLDKEVDLRRTIEQESETQRNTLEATIGHRTNLVAEIREQLEKLWDHGGAAEETATGGRPWISASAPTGDTNRVSRLPQQSSGGRLASTVTRIRAGFGWFSLRDPGSYRSILAMLRNPLKLRDAYVISTAGLFDAAYYHEQNPDLSATRLTKLAHFVLIGAYEGRSPHPLFDTRFYVTRNPDVTAARLNPVCHYLWHGAVEGRSPHPLFDVQYYLAKNPDVIRSGFEPLTHFLFCGANENRNPSPFFDCAYYRARNPDIAQLAINPLIHFVLNGWREGRRPNLQFDPAYYLEQYPDVRSHGLNPLVHYVEFGQLEGRRTVAPHDREVVRSGAAVAAPLTKIRSRSLGDRSVVRPVVVCLSHVMPFPPRAGNEYRIYRMLRSLRDHGYITVPVIAPLPGDQIEPDAVRALAGEFSNAILCDRDGRLDYVLKDIPDVLGSLHDEAARPIGALLGEDRIHNERELELLEVDRVFCHDALITTVLRLHQVLGPYVLLAEYIWMSRILPLISGDVLKVIDTIDVFSSKRDKVVQFGIDDHHVEAVHEAGRLQRADLIVAIQDDEHRALQQLVPGKRIVTAGVDFDVIQTEAPSGRRLLYVASDNPMNRKGIRDFLRFAWPAIRNERPDAELLVAGGVGGTITGDVPGVIRLGRVEDLEPLYRQVRVVINPAVAGTGLKIKTVEALGHFRSVVTWPSGTDGLAPELAALCTVVHDWYEFAKRVSSLLAPDQPRLFSEAEREVVFRLQSPARVYGELTSAFDLFFERHHSTGQRRS